MRKTEKVRMRKNTRYFYLIVSLLISVFALCKILWIFSNDNIVNKNVELYSYKNKFNYNYNVNLINNNYTDDMTLTGKNAYVSDLIDNIDFNINYSYIGSKSSNIEYTYQVKGILTSVYTEDGDEQKVLEKNYTLSDEKSEKSDDGKFNLNEKLKLDLSEQINLIKDFEQKMNMTVESYYTIILEVNTKTIIQNQEITNTYKSTIRISGIAKKITRISGENGKDETEYINSTKEEISNNKPIQLIIFSVLAIISLIIFKYVLNNTEETSIIKNVYRQELNRILKLCNEKIVQVKGKPEKGDRNLIEVKDFGELIKLSEELFKPILYWENDNKDESWFVIMSNNLIYRFILKK